MESEFFRITILLRRCPISTYKRLPRSGKKVNKRDEFVSWTAHVLLWIRDNWKSIAEVAIAAVVVCAVIYFASAYWSSRSSIAAELYYKATEMKAGSDEQLEKLRELANSYSRTSSGKEAMMILGDSYLEKGENEKAIEQFKTLAGRTRNQTIIHIAALHRLGGAQLAANDPVAAAETFKKAAADPNNLLKLRSLLRAAGSLERAKDFQSAYSLYEEIVKDSKEDDKEVKDISEGRLLWLIANGYAKG